MDRFKKIIFPIAVVVISIILIYRLTPLYHPFGGVEIKSTEEKITGKAIEYLRHFKLEFDKDKITTNFQLDKRFVQWINSRFNLDEANRILKEQKSGYYWSVSQVSNDEDVVVSSSSSEPRVNKATSFNLKLLDDGRIIEFENSTVDSITVVNLSEEDAMKIAVSFTNLARNDIELLPDSAEAPSNANQFVLSDVESSTKNNNLEHTFIWKTNNSNGINRSLTIKISGTELKLFKIVNEVPKEFASDQEDIFRIVSTILYTLLIIISVIVVGFKKFRAYELGLKLAVIFALVVLISFVSKELFAQISNFKLNMALGLGLGGIFIAGAALILWAVSETIFRETWNDKFLVFDLLIHKKIFHSFVARSVLNGIAFGLGLTAFFYLILMVVSFYSPLYFVGDNFNSFSHVTAKLPILDIFLGVFNSYAFIGVSFFMFLAAGIKRYINSDVVFILVGSIVWTLLVPSKINPITLALPINFLIGLILNLILFKYDLLAAILSYLLFEFFIKANQFLFISEDGLHSKWVLLFASMVVIIVLLVILQIKKDSFTDYDSITPKFVENITERQRLKRELEVARVVQMSFLPASDPRISGIDISSICIPALEVGGDYYDFIKLGDSKLGIIIGDVSGKGTQAAFYMTLTKGFLKALAKQTDSPAEVLTKMNELFYENVERGRFISMVYAIIDYKNMRIKIARAGHNPIITQDVTGKISLINPKGIALGLEKGELFGRVITEHEEQLSRDKVYIFYTDGFTEAANKNEEEYGLERMYEIVQKFSYAPAKEIKERLVEDVNKFIGKSKQHDDMTMVIIKVN